MAKLAVALVLLCVGIGLAPVATAIKRNGPVITLDGDDENKCDEGGGCYVITKKALSKMVLEAQATATAISEAGCKANDRDRI